MRVEVAHWWICKNKIHSLSYNYIGGFEMAYLVFANSGSGDLALGVLFGGSYHLNKNEME